ncbi:MAG: hypothetical protein SGI97_03065 [candidate division Zixibacteria bacterium]|nr:hypothetical protein [candidate division Zixibacteria bacterium]
MANSKHSAKGKTDKLANMRESLSELTKKATAGDKATREVDGGENDYEPARFVLQGQRAIKEKSIREIRQTAIEIVKRRVENGFYADKKLLSKIAGSIADTIDYER